MKAAETLFRITFHAGLLAAAVLTQALLRSPPAAGLVFALAAAYARIAALGAGASILEEALLLAETMPFVAFCSVFSGGVEAARALLALAEAAAAGTALLSIESLVQDDRARGRLDGLGKAAMATAFVAAAALAGLAMEHLRAAPLLGAAATVSALCAYAKRRRG